MAIRITRIDDIDGTDGAEAMSLELDHTMYEIDLCPRNRARLLRVMRPFIERARPLESDGGSGPTTMAGSQGAYRYRKNLRDDRESSEDVDSSPGGLDLIEMAREVRD